MIYYIAPIQYKRADGRKYANKFAYLVSPITRYSLEPKTLMQIKSIVADTIGTIGFHIVVTSSYLNAVLKKLVRFML